MNATTSRTMKPFFSIGDSGGEARIQAFGASQPIIHGVPNLSTSMPNDSAQNVFCSGMVTRPPCGNASNTRFASARGRRS